MSRIFPGFSRADKYAVTEIIKAAGGRWFPEGLLWYVKYGAIVGGPLEKHIYLDNKDKLKKTKNHLHVDDGQVSTYR
jgi:hypothetical protein